MGPLYFEPYYRPQVWGGRKLQTLLDRKLPGPGKFGETWEISAHPHHVSKVADGPLEGATLTELHQGRTADLYGRDHDIGAKFPLLVKILDCEQLLSVQVHPNDVQAAEILGDEKGKTEAWVVMDVGPEGRIYAGLKEGVDKAEFERRLAENAIESCLHSFAPKVGDCLFLRAGTVHAVGGGVLMAEVQQSSDATFRLFDWNRPGDDGKRRKLHIAESLACINFAAGPVQPQAGEAIAELTAGNIGERLVQSEFFGMDRYILKGRLNNPYPNRMAIWIILEGEAEFFGEDGVKTYARGDTVLFPATSEDLSWQPASSARPTTILAATLPEPVV